MSATIHCCAECPRIFGHRSAGVFHAVKTGHTVAPAPGVRLKEHRALVDPPMPPHARHMDTTVHSCTGCGAYHTLVAFSAQLHVARCGGRAVKRQGVTLFAEPPAPSAEPPPPAAPPAGPPAPPAARPAE